jgi:hypothetical protein
MTLLLPEHTTTFRCPCSGCPIGDGPCRWPVQEAGTLCDVCRPYDRRRDEDPRPVQIYGERRRRQ